MKKLFYFLMPLFLLSITVVFYGCGKSDPVSPIDPGSGNTGATQTFTSSGEGTFTYDGFSMIIQKETVPRQAGGGEGTVVFSMNTSSSTPSGLPNLPSEYTAISKFLNAGPESFIFNNTVRLVFDGSSQSSPTGVKVLSYYPETNDWRIVPSYVLDGQNKKIGADVLKLGWFVMVSTPNPDNSATASGGFQFCSHNGLDFIIVTIKSATFAEPGLVSASYAAGLVGATFVSPNIPGSVFPSDYCRGILPLGTYEVWVSTRNFASQEIYTYSVPYTFTISSPLNWPLGWIYSAADGWTIFGCQAPAGGTWVLGRPQNWPTPTVPYGSGVMQATLTWHNSNTSSADLDLHLYGPNGIHVYYSTPTTADFKLDRDWQSALGNATENIYSLNSTMPSGAYTVRVKHYLGASMNFSTRFVLNGAASNYSGTISSGQEITVKSFNIP